MVVQYDNEDKRGQNVCGVKRSCGRRGCRLGRCVRRQCRRGRFEMGRAVPVAKTRTTAKNRTHVLYARCFVAYRRCVVVHVAHAVDQPVYLNFFRSSIRCIISILMRYCLSSISITYKSSISKQYEKTGCFKKNTRQLQQAITFE